MISMQLIIVINSVVVLNSGTSVVLKHPPLSLQFCPSVIPVVVGQFTLLVALADVHVHPSKSVHVVVRSEIVCFVPSMQLLVPHGGVVEYFFPADADTSQQYPPFVVLYKSFPQ